MNKTKIKRKNSLTNIILITGPTAVGKTALCITLAQQLQTEIISADSRQFYQGLKIGTAQPTPTERNAAAHHFVDFLPPDQRYSAHDYAKDVKNRLKELNARGIDTVILTGGSGFYIEAVCDGIVPIPDIPIPIREHWQKELQKKGLQHLQKELKKVDSLSFNKIDLKNPRRLLRALEVYTATSCPFSQWIHKKEHNQTIRVLRIALNRPKEELYARINQRVLQMIKEGLCQEVAQLKPYWERQALQTIGYREMIPHLEGREKLEDAISSIQKSTRQYAKRQLTWLRKYPAVWFHPTQQEEIIQQAIQFIESNK